MTSQIPSRPQWYHQDVRTAAVAAVYPELRDWAVKMSVVKDDAADKELKALFTLAVLESADAYAAGRYLDNHYDWPVNGELVRVLDHAFNAMNVLVTEFTHKWVMEHKVRFPNKVGHMAKFRVGPAEVTGVIIAVIGREARGIVQVGTRDKEKTMSVNAEDIITVSPVATPKRTPPTGNGGGTPVAARGGAVLSEVKAA